LKCTARHVWSFRTGLVLSGLVSSHCRLRPSSQRYCSARRRYCSLSRFDTADVLRPASGAGDDTAVLLLLVHPSNTLILHHYRCSSYRDLGCSWSCYSCHRCAAT
jgi:hypothetical protein